MSIKINPLKNSVLPASNKTNKIMKGSSGLPLEEPLTRYKDEKLAQILDPSAPMANALRKIETTIQTMNSFFKK